MSRSPQGGGGGPGQYSQMSHNGEGGGLKSAKKVSRTVLFEWPIIIQKSYQRYYLDKQ